MSFSDGSGFINPYLPEDSDGQFHLDEKVCYKNELNQLEYNPLCMVTHKNTGETKFQRYMGDPNRNGLKESLLQDIHK